MTIRVFTAFSGYDSQCMALDKIGGGISYELVGWSEIDKYAIRAHNAVYPQWADRNFGDISKIGWKEVPDFDLFTYSFPCQDISNAGNQKGFEEGSGTRSSLLWECKRAIESKRPKYLVMENVKALTYKKFAPLLEKWMETLSEMGYSNHLKVLNSKDFGCPQSRDRVFMVSILGEDNFEFPNPMPLKKHIRDILESRIDEKYYLSQKIQNRFHYINGKENIIGSTAPSFRTIGERDIVYKTSGIMGTLVATDYKQPKQIAIERNGSMVIRKITPRECFRLMCVSEGDIDKIQEGGISDTQQYKLAGNSIVVDVLYYIFKELFFGEHKKAKKEPVQLSLF